MRAVLCVLFCLVAGCGADRRPPAPGAATSATSARPPDDDVLAGVVEGPDGSGASGAVVALNRPKGKRMALVRTDEHGRFRLPQPREPFAITVTGAKGTALFVPPVDPGKSPPLPSRLRLGDASGGTVIAGTLKCTGGAFPVGTLVSASRVSKDEGDLFYGEISKAGAFVLTLPPGTYQLGVDSDELVLNTIKVSGDAGVRVEVVLDASRRAPAPDEVVAWLKEKAIPISTAEVGAPDQDLAPLASAFGAARVIGVGEATHGTLEFTRIKHRLLERLAAAPGAVVLAMEANFAAAEQVDDYLQTGKGTPEKAVHNMFRVWQTEEMRDLLLWMRKWNADPKHRRKIRFRGFDVQGARESLTALRAYLRRVDPPSESLLGALAPLDAPTNNRGMIELTDAQKTETGAAAARLVDQFAAQQKAYVARSSVAAYALAAQHARVVQQAQALFAAPTFPEQFAARDRAMGDNVVWLLEQAERDARIVVWAHNNHLQLDSSSLPGTNMGIRLRERLGKEYVSVGFVLNEGKYRACPDPKDPKTTVEVSLDPAAPGYASEAFARAGIPIAAVDLRAAPQGIVSDWLTAPHIVVSHGWIVSEAQRKGSPSSLAGLFDVVIYVDHTTASQPLRQ